MIASRTRRIGLTSLTLAAAIVVAIWPGHGAVIRDGAALSAALEKAKGGEVLRLAPGNFGTVELWQRAFASPVIITSDDAKRPAQIDRLKLTDVSGVTFRDLEIGNALAAGEPEYAKMAEVRQGVDLRFERVFVHGSLDGNPGNDAWGFYFVGCRNITVADSRFEELMRGMVFDRSQQVAVTGSRFRHMRSDGANFASVQGVTIDRNHFSDFRPNGTDHADAIQFWTTQGPPSADITISNNVVLEGDGPGPQGIFVSDGQTGPHQRVRILNNLIYSSGQWHGINVSQAEDVVVRGNTTLSRQNDDKVLWIYVGEVARAEIDGNVTERLLLVGTSGIKERDNTILEKEPGVKRKIKGLDAGAQAAAEALVLEGRGYQPSAGRPN
jgi:hypothetical protein